MPVCRWTPSGSIRWRDSATRFTPTRLPSGSREHSTPVIVLLSYLTPTSLIPAATSSSSCASFTLLLRERGHKGHRTGEPTWQSIRGHDRFDLSAKLQFPHEPSAAFAPSRRFGLDPFAIVGREWRLSVMYEQFVTSEDRYNHHHN